MVRKRFQDIYRIFNIFFVCTSMDEPLAISVRVMNKMVSQEYMAGGNADNYAIER
jgi:hypothetical protein